MWRKEQQWHSQRCPLLQQTNTAEGKALEHPSVGTLLGSTDKEILDVVEQVYRRQNKVVPSVLPHRLQDQFVARLHEELGQHLVRASLQSLMATAQSLSRRRKHLQTHSSSQARSPSAESRRKEIAKWLRGDSTAPTAEATEAKCNSTRVSHQSANKQVRHLSRLSQDPTGVPHHLQAHCTHTAQTSNCTTL